MTKKLTEVMVCIDMKLISWIIKEVGVMKGMVH